MSDYIEAETTPGSKPAAPARALSRREFLRVVLGAGGVVLVASLPDEWSPPVVEAASLPPHALTSAPTPTPVTTAPSQLSATVSQRTVSLSWTMPSGSSRIERSQDKVTWTVIANVNAKAYTDADPGLQIGVTYYYRVRAVRGDSTVTEPSNIASATPWLGITGTP